MTDRPRVQPSLQIADELRRRIEAGDYGGPGSQLPSHGVLAEEFATTPKTVGRALQLLQQAGLVDIVPRWGTYVHDAAAEAIEEEFPPAAGDDEPGQEGERPA